MNLQTLLQDFNPGNFVVYISLLVFICLCSLRFDGIIQSSYWAIFTPLWIWKLMVLIGATVGICSWWKRSSSRVDLESYIHFKAMLLSLSLHLLVLLFELLACDKLQSGRHIWVLVFLPLFFLAVVSIAVCVWALKHDRPFEMELFASINLLQFIFVALRLDGFVTWRWELVFIPLWFTFGLALIGVSYSFLLALVLFRSTNISGEQRRVSAQAALGYASLVIPGLVSQVLLMKKLDGEIELPYSLICIPLLVSLSTLVLRSLSARGGNLWWCGMQKDFCLFLLDFAPSLREYGNTSYSSSNSDRRETSPETANLSPNRSSTATAVGLGIFEHKHPGGAIIKSDSRTVVPVLAIDIPD